MPGSPFVMSHQSAIDNHPPPPIVATHWNHSLIFSNITACAGSLIWLTIPLGTWGMG